jgi:lipopolysaccharide transport system ATP-binding protein
MRFLRRFQEHGTILFVSHDTGAVLNLCQRALWLRDGTCAMSGPAKAVVEAYMRSNLEATQHLAPSDQVPSAAEPSIATPPLEPGEGLPAAPETPASRAEGWSFGAGGAHIRSVAVFGADGRSRSAVLGGEHVELRIVVEASKELDSTIVGFHLKDRLGQILFGENTCLVTAGAPVSLRAGESAVASFGFSMPYLRSDKYTLDVAVADGTRFQHVHHQWFFDVTVVEVLTDRPVAGLFTVGDLAVTLTKA